jgi:hypothetical protein
MNNKMIAKILITVEISLIKIKISRCLMSSKIVVSNQMNLDKNKICINKIINIKILVIIKTQKWSK